MLQGTESRKPREMLKRVVTQDQVGVWTADCASVLRRHSIRLSHSTPPDPPHHSQPVSFERKARKEGSA